MDWDFAAIGQLVRTLPASYPILVHRLASLLRASFRPRLAASVISPLRFAITSRPLCCEEDLPGRPGEFRPEPPTDPDVNLSIHPARATPKKATAFRHGHYPVSSLLRSSAPLASASHGSSTWTFSLNITDPVLKFRTKARIRVMPPKHRTPHDQ